MNQGCTKYGNIEAGCAAEKVEQRIERMEDGERILQHGVELGLDVQCG